MTYFEWAGVITGIVGSFILGSKKADRSSVRFWGFGFFALSNVAWIVFGILDVMVSIIVLQLAFSVTTIRGLVNNWPRHEHR